MKTVEGAQSDFRLILRAWEILPTSKNAFCVYKCTACQVVNDVETEINLFDESSGTQKLFGLLPFIAESLITGTVLVIDELDAKIHPVRANSLNKINPELQYYAAWSNECIEFWFLLYFAYYTANNHRTEYISFLKKMKMQRKKTIKQL